MHLNLGIFSILKEDFTWFFQMIISPRVFNSFHFRVLIEDSCSLELYLPSDVVNFNSIHWMIDLKWLIYLIAHSTVSIALYIMQLLFLITPHISSKPYSFHYHTLFVMDKVANSKELIKLHFHLSWYHSKTYYLSSLNSWKSFL